MRNIIWKLTGTLGLMLMLAGTAFAGEMDTMGDAQHRKHMSGMHHPSMGAEERPSGEGEKGMGSMQHRKHMGGMHHPNGDNPCADGEMPMMSDPQHRKHMGSGKHEYHERTDNPED